MSFPTDGVGQRRRTTDSTGEDNTREEDVMKLKEEESRGCTREEAMVEVKMITGLRQLKFLKRL